MTEFRIHRANSDSNAHLSAWIVHPPLDLKEPFEIERVEALVEIEDLSDDIWGNIADAELIAREAAFDYWQHSRRQLLPFGEFEFVSQVVKEQRFMLFRITSHKATAAFHAHQLNRAHDEGVAEERMRTTTMMPEFPEIRAVRGGMVYPASAGGWSAPSKMMYDVGYETEIRGDSTEVRERALKALAGKLMIPESMLGVEGAVMDVKESMKKVGDAAKKAKIHIDSMDHVGAQHRSAMTDGLERLHHKTNKKNRRKDPK